VITLYRLLSHKDLCSRSRWLVATSNGGRSSAPGSTSSQAGGHLTPTSYSSNCRLQTLSEWQLVLVMYPRHGPQKKHLFQQFFYYLVTSLSARTAQKTPFLCCLYSRCNAESSNGSVFSYNVTIYWSNLELVQPSLITVNKKKQNIAAITSKYLPDDKFIRSKYHLYKIVK
jgi:hypothetical protein